MWDCLSPYFYIYRGSTDVSKSLKIHTQQDITTILLQQYTQVQTHVSNRAAWAIDEDHFIAALRNELIWHALYFQYHHCAICLCNRKCAIVNNFTLLITLWKASILKPYIHYCLLSYLCSFFLTLFFTFFYTHFFVALSGFIA